MTVVRVEAMMPLQPVVPPMAASIISLPSCLKQMFSRTTMELSTIIPGLKRCSQRNNVQVIPENRQEQVAMTEIGMDKAITRVLRKLRRKEHQDSK